MAAKRVRVYTEEQKQRIREYQKRYRQQPGFRERDKAYHAKWYAKLPPERKRKLADIALARYREQMSADPEVIRARARRSYRRKSVSARFKKARSQYIKAYRQRHLERCRQYSRNDYQRWRDLRISSKRDYHKRNPDVAQTSHHTRRAREMSLGGSHTTAQWLDRLSIFGFRCAYCGCEGRMTRDHMIPVSRGGTNWPSNIVPACRSCNSRKHNKTFTEFVMQLRREGRTRFSLYEFLAKRI